MKSKLLRLVLMAAVLLAPTAIYPASAQVPGSPVTSTGQPSLSGQPYVKTHKRHNKNFYGKHYDSFKHSKGSG
jgi:hypothetical protein